MDRNAKVVAFFTLVSGLALGYVVHKLPGPIAAPVAWLGMFLPIAAYLSFSLPFWDRLAGSSAGAFVFVAFHGLYVLITGGSLQSTAILGLLTAIAGGMLFLGKRSSPVLWGIAALAVLWLPYELRFIAPLHLPTERGLNIVPVILLDIGLYLYLVYWKLDGVGFDFGLTGRDILAAVRNFAIVAIPLAGLGLLLGFIEWDPVSPNLERVLLKPLSIYFLNALPEEFMFRGVLHNLLARRMTYPGSLVLSAVIFGIAHVNNPWPNWSYVIMATLAGYFYGRAYVQTGKCTASALVHTFVNYTWALLFKL